MQLLVVLVQCADCSIAQAFSVTILNRGGDYTLKAVVSTKKPSFESCRA